MFSVEYRSAKSNLTRVNCEIDSLSIGKADSNLIVLRGWTVGKRHATIHKRASGFFVEDHGAMGATEVNGRAIEKEYGPLRAEDVIRIGDNYLNVIVEAAILMTELAPAPMPLAGDVATTFMPVPKPVVKQLPEQHAAVPAMPDLTARMNAARRALHGKLISQMDLRRV
ncbi:MAG: FHA domain-containing protein, partial [Rhodoferax sp.]|nr:FHA domain-containing protein [Rhodoferax sp.]